MQQAREGESARSNESRGLRVRPVEERKFKAGDTWDLDSLFLVRGLAKEWPAVQHWSPTTWSERFGERKVDAYMDLPGTGVTFPKDQDAYKHTMELREFLRAMVSGPALPCYLAYQRIGAILPELEKDYDFGSIGDPKRTEETDTRMWVGSGATRSMLHSDLKSNIFVQVWGTKRVHVIPFEQSNLVYPFPDNLVNSMVDVDEVDAQRFPKFRRADVQTAVLEPGDVLFMPRGVWHYFKSLEPSISLNHWLGPSLTAQDYLRLLLQLGPRYWLRTAQDFVRHGLLGVPHQTTFFFSPPPTGKRLYDLVRSGNFSEGNDPAKRKASS